MALPLSAPQPARSQAARTPSSTAQNQAGRQYLQSQIETASPARLIVMLYDGAIRFCAQACEAMRASDLEAQNTNLIKTQRILGELMGCLDREAGGEVAANLFRLYTYMLEKLVEANLRDQLEPVEEVRGLLTELRDTWLEVERHALMGSGLSEAVNAVPTALPQEASRPRPVPRALRALQTFTQDNSPASGLLGQCDA